jgi:hypothetical protein
VSAVPLHSYPILSSPFLTLAVKSITVFISILCMREDYSVGWTRVYVKRAPLLDHCNLRRAQSSSRGNRWQNAPLAICYHHCCGNSISLHLFLTVLSSPLLSFPLLSSPLLTGTAKPTKYTLIYDEIKMTVSEHCTATLIHLSRLFESILLL